MSVKRRLLTIGHSYVIAQNRRLADEMARAASNRWDVTVAAPSRMQGDLRMIEFEPLEDEACATVRLPVWLGGHPHLRFYGRGLRPLVGRPWDLVHCWQEPYVLAAAQIAAALRRGTRFVPTTFQNIAKQYPLPVALLERAVMERASGWIAFGETVRETHRARLSYAEKPFRVITPGVDVRVFSPDPAARRAVREALGWSDSDDVVGFLGRFVPEKGIGTLIDAVERQRVPWKLLFVGDGPLRRDIERARAGLASRIAVVTGVPHGSVPAYLNAMDVLCAPSRTTPRWREQFGRMLIEAMACGVAVVASDSGEIPHVVADAGLLLPEEDPGAWATELDRLAGDPRLRHELGQLALERARTHFAWPIIARAHLRFFEELCEA